MKKIYLSAALLACTLMNAQAPFWTATSYKGAFPVTDNTPATNWTSGWSNFDPENTVYGAATQTVSADITANTTWSGIVCLQNKVYVKNNAVLTIQPGTIIRGDKATQGSLIITRGAQINAAGTMASPIVFTSNESVGNRAEGDWGGLVVLGNAINNQPGGVANIEGITPTLDTEFGGTNDNDNSGVLKYIRIEFAGIALQPNKEINGLTLGSVGSATQMDHIQVSFSGDDSFEWFGGTVDAKWLIAYRGLDDDFDCDFGFRGRIQFGLIIRDKDLSDAIGDSNAWECDNDGTGSSATPFTRPVFSNITVVGPKGNGTIGLPVGEKFEKSFRLRRNSAVSVFNSLSTGWEKGLSIEAANTEAQYTSGNAYFSNNILTNYATATKVVTAANSFYATFFGANGNDTTTTIAQINWVNIFTALGTTPDPRLNTGSSAATGAAFTNTVFGSSFTGIKNSANFSDKFVSVYPNPAADVATLVIDAVNASSLNVNIYDINGKLVSTPVINQNLVSGENTFTLNTSNLNNGVYFVTLNSTNGKETVKLVVSK
ncbi:MAG: T9SS type A sorting domain-containing protein [Bacteroidota bacterium]|nr:T9SS type A sorting domain-containing protein [Bacteroidota bacterium]